MAEKEVTFNEDGSANIPLSKQYTLAGVPQASVRMREPTVDDQLAMDAMKESDAMKELNLVANLCMVTPAELRKLTSRDYKAVQRQLVAFSV